MKIITTLQDENDNTLARIETSSMEAHEEEMHKIQRKVDEMVENQINDELENQNFKHGEEKISNNE